MAASRKATFLPVASISVTRSPGAMIASGRPGRPAPDADVDQPRAVQFNLTDDPQQPERVDEMQPLDRRRFADRGQVEPLVPLQQQVAIARQRRDLLLIERRPDRRRRRPNLRSMSSPQAPRAQRRESVDGDEGTRMSGLCGVPY